MVFLTSLQSIIPIVLLISLGYILKGRGMFHPIFSGNLSRFIMSVALPAGVFCIGIASSTYIGFMESSIWDASRYINLCNCVYRCFHHDESIESTSR